MIRIAVGCIPHQFGEDGGAASRGVIEIFQHQHAGAFPDDEPIAACVPRPRGGCRILITGRECAHGSETGHRERGHRGFRAAADHHVGFSALDHPVRLTHGVGTCGASGGTGQVRAGRAIANRDLAGGQIGDGGGDEERGDAVWAGRDQLAVLALNHFKSTDAAAYVDTDLLGIFDAHVQARLDDGELRSRQGKLDEPPHLLDFFALNKVFWVEIMHFTGDAAAKPFRVKKSDTGDAGLAPQERRPGDVRPYPHRADQADPGYYDTTLLSDHCDESAETFLHVLPKPAGNPAERPRALSATPCFGSGCNYF